MGVAAVEKEEGKGSAWGGWAVLLVGVGKLLTGRKPLWFLLSLEFRKS